MYKKTTFTFKKAIFYRKLSIILILLDVLPAVLKKWIIAIPIAILAIYFGNKYACPYCGKKFDSRIFPDEFKYCPNCKKELFH